MSLILSNKIIRERPNGLCSPIVEGKRGIGKSAYCLKTMKEVFQKVYECSESEAYDTALKYTLYDIEDIIFTLEDAIDKKEPLPVVTWDDAGVHGSSLQWFFKMDEVNQLKAITDTIRSAVTGFLINCPDRNNLLNFLRNYDDYLVTIVKAPGGGNKYVDEAGITHMYKNYERVARGYNIFKLPSGKRLVFKNFEDEYSCFVPNAFYERYEERRKKYLSRALKELKELREERLSKKKIDKIDIALKEMDLSEKMERLEKKKQDELMRNMKHGDGTDNTT